MERMEDRRMLAAGDLSSLVIDDLGAGMNEQILASAVQTDGKIVVGGYVSTASQGRDFLIARYNADGTRDTSFGGGDGIFTLHFNSGTGFDDVVNDIAIDPSGRIIAVGSVRSGTVDAIGIVRLTADGELDTTFDEDGIVATVLQNVSNVNISSRASAVALQADGKIVVGGGAFNGSSTDWDFAVARYNDDGSLDATFDTDGYVITDFAAEEDFLTDIAVQGDGSIVAAGYGRSVGDVSNFALVRYTATGSLDASFDGDGKVMTNVGAAISQDQAHAMALTTDGQIVVAGWSAISNQRDFSIARYNGDGSLDTTFGASGTQKINFGLTGDMASAITIQPDGKYVLAGSTGSSPTSAQELALARLNSDGTLDTTFGAAGTGRVRTLTAGTNVATITDVQIHQDGRIVAAGYARFTGEDIDAAIARYETGVVNVSAGGAYTVNEGDPVVLSGVGGVTPGDFAWDFDDNGVDEFDDAFGSNPTFSAAVHDGDSSVTIKLRVALPGGGFAIDEATIHVVNVPPVLTISGDANVNEGATYTLNLAETDIDADTITSWTIDWGDGGVSQVVSGNPSSVTHTFADNRATPYTINAWATDDDGIHPAENAVSVTVDNVTPALSIGGDASVDEGATYTLNLSSSDPGDDTIAQWTIDWGDSIEIVSGNPGSATHVYADGNASYTISATATDEDGTYAAAGGFTLNVANVAPTLTISGASTAEEGATYTLNLSSSDPGNDTITSWTIDWGDGSGAETVPGGATSVTHVYAVGNASYNITAAATDEDGSHVANELVVAVEVPQSDGVFLVDGVLHIVRENEENNIASITGSGGSIVVTLDGETTSFNAADVEEIQVVMGSGHDIVVVSAGITAPMTIDGGAGNDLIVGGSGDDLLIGGEGNDVLVGGAGDNILLGGDGNDDLLGGPGNNVLVGGNGNDIVLGGSGRDVIIGSQDSDLLSGGSGDDILIGGHTIHDNDVDALDAIMETWGSSDSFNARVATLTGSGGLLEAGMAVFDDDEFDILLGGAGRDLIFGDTNPWDGAFDLILLQASQDRLIAVN